MRITELMRVLQFADSALPVGAFSFSNGLESAVQLRVVHDVETLRHYVFTVTQQAASADGIALLEAHCGATASDLQRVLCADRAVYNRKLNEELRTMTVRMGRKLGELAEQVIDAPLLAAWLEQVRQGQAPGSYPVGLALIFAALDMSGAAAFAAHQYGVATMVLGAALRLIKVSYMDTQAILFDVNQAAEAEYERIAGATLDDMSTFAPVIDILAANHVKTHVRMFMN